MSTTVTMANNIKTEQVTITVNISHDNRGDLKVLLTSPLGTSSTLVDVNNSDTGDNYNNWVFSTVRNWGESSVGDWTLTVSDLSNTSIDIGVSGGNQTPQAPYNNYYDFTINDTSVDISSYQFKKGRSIIVLMRVV